MEALILKTFLAFYFLLFKGFHVLKWRELFFGCAQGMQKFLGQGLNPCHSSDPSYNSDNAKSFSHGATRELHFVFGGKGF